MSRLEKAFLRFAKPWWRGHEDGLGYPGKFATPKNALETNPDKLNQEMFMYSSLAEPDSHPTMMFYIYGSNSHNLTTQLQTHPLTSQEYHTTLIHFFKPYYSLLPGYSEDDPACQPSKVLCLDWEHDEYSGGGSYSHFNVPTEDMKPMLEVIRTAMGPERGVWLAGEHTAPDGALAMSVGAYWSGEEATRRVLEAFGAVSDSGV
jgi:hypothetical protein